MVMGEHGGVSVCPAGGEPLGVVSGKWLWARGLRPDEDKVRSPRLKCLGAIYTVSSFLVPIEILLIEYDQWGITLGLATDAVPDMTDFHQPPQIPDKTAKKVENKTNPVVEGLQTLGLSIVLALGIRTFVAEARYIPSGSMEPTLEVNDRLVVEKISYHLNPPKRGDIIVFWPPESLFEDEENKRKDAFIKRVIGVPGDTVEVRDGTVFINGEPQEEDYIKAPPNYTWGPETVPPESYLVLGDNRNSSFDSHAWEPDSFVPQENIIGKAVVRFWPPNRIGGLN